MNKKCVILYFEGKPVAVCEIKEVAPLEFVQIKKESEANLQEYVRAKREADQKTKQEFELVWKTIKFLKGEEEEENDELE